MAAYVALSTEVYAAVLGAALRPWSRLSASEAGNWTGREASTSMKSTMTRVGRPPWEHKVGRSFASGTATSCLTPKASPLTFWKKPPSASAAPYPSLAGRGE